MRILVIEDDEALGAQIVEHLQGAGYETEWIRDGDEARKAEIERFQMIVLDLMLPGTYGLDLLKLYRERSDVPVLILSARQDTNDKVRALKLGADDYVTKPFSPRELTARIGAVLRRASGSMPAAASGPLRAGQLEVDTVAHETRRGGRAVHLTAKEYDLLVHLMSHPRRAFRREELLESVWGWTYGDAATVTVHVRRLRVKLEEDPSTPRHLITVAGGYRFEP